MGGASVTARRRVWGLFSVPSPYTPPIARRLGGGDPPQAPGGWRRWLQSREGGLNHGAGPRSLVRAVPSGRGSRGRVRDSEAGSQALGSKLSTLASPPRRVRRGSRCLPGRCVHAQTRCQLPNLVPGGSQALGRSRSASRGPTVRSPASGGRATSERSKVTTVKPWGPHSCTTRI